MRVRLVLKKLVVFPAAERKFVIHPKAGREQLFDLQSDLHELHNLSGDAAHRARRDELEGRLKAWRQKNGDPNL